MTKKVTIQAKKYDGRLHFEWDATLIEQTFSYALVYCEAGRIFTHHSKQKQFVMPYPSLEWFYFDRGYTVAISFKPEGLMYYCNIALPAKLEEQIISFIDLDLDYLKEVEEEWQVVDEDEFLNHQQLYAYPDDVIQHAYQTLEQLKKAVNQNNYPFSLSEQELVEKLNIAQSTKQLNDIRDQ